MYVLFYGDKRTHWWELLLKKGFYHCELLWYEPTLRKWISQETTSAGVEVNYFTPKQFDRHILARQREDRARFLRIDHCGVQRIRLRPILCCSTFVAQALCLPWYVITPQQVWSAAMKLGNVEAFND